MTEVFLSSSVSKAWLLNSSKHNMCISNTFHIASHGKNPSRASTHPSATPELVPPAQALLAAHQTQENHNLKELSLNPWDNLLSQSFATLVISTSFTLLSAAHITFRAALVPSTLYRNQVLANNLLYLLQLCCWACSPRESASYQSLVIPCLLVLRGAVCLIWRSSQECNSLCCLSPPQELCVNDDNWARCTRTWYTDKTFPSDLWKQKMNDSEVVAKMKRGQRKSPECYGVIN